MIKSLVSYEKPTILLIQESKVENSIFDKLKMKFWPSCSAFINNLDGKSGGLLTLWDNSQAKCTLEIQNQNWMGVRVRCLQTKKIFRLANVYGL